MNCAEFKIWLLDENAHDQVADQEAKLHMVSCPRCEKLYTIDQMVAERFKEKNHDIKVWTDEGLVYAMVT